MPCGSGIAPRTIWSDWVTSIPRLMWTSTVSSNFARLSFLSSATACLTGTARLREAASRRSGGGCGVSCRGAAGLPASFSSWSRGLGNRRACFRPSGFAHSHLPASLRPLRPAGDSAGGFLDQRKLPVQPRRLGVGSSAGAASSFFFAIEPLVGGVRRPRATTTPPAAIPWAARCVKDHDYRTERVSATVEARISLDLLRPAHPAASLQTHA